MKNSLGKVKWFDASQHHGVVSGVDGANYFFQRADAERHLPPLTPGQLVTFADAGHGRLGRMAAELELA